MIVVGSLTACSVADKIGKSARNATNFSSQQSENNTVAVDEKLVIPPSLRRPDDVKKQSSTRKITSSAYQKPRSKNYYIVVGTYPDQEQALDTFVRLSSIGLSNATMESRATKSGKNLHMVRLGPYSNQEDIDKTKDSLTNDGLSQFKVVED